MIRLVDGGHPPRSTRRPLVERRAEPEVQALERGEPEGAARFLPEMLEELKAIARAHLRRQPTGHSLEPIELVHEAYLRLSGDADATWNGRVHFLAVAALAMRQLLTDHARKKGAAQRGAGWLRVSLSGVSVPGHVDADITDLHDALEELTQLDPRQARVVELRYFGGLTIDEVAQALGCSTTTIENDWSFARAWLQDRLAGA